MRFEELLFAGTCVMAFWEMVAVFMGLSVLAEACAVSLVTMLGLWCAIVLERKQLVKQQKKRAAMHQQKKKRIRTRNAVANVTGRGK